MLQCLRLFNAKGKFGDQLSYCIGLELSDATYYIKAESAKIYNEWIEVRLYVCDWYHTDSCIVCSLLFYLLNVVVYLIPRLVAPFCAQKGLG